MEPLQAQMVVNYKRFRFGDLVKRLFDIVAASLGLIVLSPAFAMISLLIKRDSKGPVFYRGCRIGKEGRPFRILKFRTMFEDMASYEGPCVTSYDDPRITPFGSWLRDTKINELPQLWNVLTGEMSLVGPRPEDPKIVATYSGELRDEILSIRPGVTSPASVLYNDEENLLTKTNLMGKYLQHILPDKLRLDQLYVRNRSLASDLDILFWTMAILVPRIAWSNIPEGYLFAGPFSRFIHRHFSWFTVDLVVAFISVSVAAIAWRFQQPLDWGWNYLALLSLLLALAFSAVNYLAGFNRIIWAEAPAEDAIGLFFSSGLVTLLTIVLNRLQMVHQWLPLPALRVELLLTIGLMAHTGFIIARYRLRLLSWLVGSLAALHKYAPRLGEPVLILGDGEKCQIASWLLKRGMFHHIFSVVGIVSDENPTVQGMRLNGCRIVGGVRDLPDLIDRYDVRVIVYTLGSAAAHIRDMVFTLSKTSKVKLVFLDDLLGFVHQPLDKPAEAREYLDWLGQRADQKPLHDSITGLPNGSLLQERLQHSLAYARRYNTSPALLFINLNGSAEMAGIAGQRAEDDLLRTVAKRLLTFKRESDTLARFEGNEFALLLENVPSNAAAQTILDRTRTLMAAPFAIKDMEVSVHADIKLHSNPRNLERALDYMKQRASTPADVEHAPWPPLNGTYAIK